MLLMYYLLYTESIIFKQNFISYMQTNWFCVISALKEQSFVTPILMEQSSVKLICKQRIFMVQASIERNSKQQISLELISVRLIASLLNNFLQLSLIVLPNSIGNSAPNTTA